MSVPTDMDASPDFVGVTELAGDPASAEQIDRLRRRYYWAAGYVPGADVLEVACGAGQGLGFLAARAKSLRGGDVSGAVLETAKRHYGSRVDLRVFNAERLPFPDASLDVVLIFEAIYYLKDVDMFITEARRVLRPGGFLLIATANKDLFDFTPSPHSVAYYGVTELGTLLAGQGFTTEFFGDTPLAAVPVWQRLLRPAKRMATSMGMMPKGKRMKALVKRFVFGRPRPLPAEIGPDEAGEEAPTRLPAGAPDRAHKVIFCAGRRSA